MVNAFSLTLPKCTLYHFLVLISGSWISTFSSKGEKLEYKSTNINKKIRKYQLVLTNVNLNLFVNNVLHFVLFALPINVKTAEPIKPKVLLGVHMTPGKVYAKSKFQKLVSN